MNAEAALELLLRHSAALTLGMLLVLALRVPWRRAFGARAALWLWWCVPLALLLASAPRPAPDMLPVPNLQLPVQAVEAGAPPPSVLAWSMSSPQEARVHFAIRTLGAGLHALAARPQVLLWLWAFGALLHGAAMWRRQRRFEHALGPLRRVGDGVYQAPLRLPSPVLIGLLRPRIVLPHDFDTCFTDAQRALVLAHERVHLRRRDLWTSLAASVLHCLFWFHPLLPFAARRLRLDQELACDEAVLRRAPHARADYARALLHTQLAVPGLPVGCFWQSSQLKARFTMIAKPLPAPTRSNVGVVMGATTALLMLSVAWAAQPAAAPAAVLASPSVQVAPLAAASLPPAASAARPATAPQDVSSPGIAPALPPAPRQSWAPVRRARLPAPSPARGRDALGAMRGVQLAWAEPLPLRSAAVVPPQLIEYVPPRRPLTMLRGTNRSIEAEVAVRFTIGVNGRPMAPTVAHSSDERFDRYALQAVRKWHFAAASRGGHAVPYHTEVRVHFPPEQGVTRLVEGIRPLGPPVHRVAVQPGDRH